jgi:transposase
VRAARAPRSRALAAADSVRAAPAGSGEDRRRCEVGRKYLVSTSDPDLSAEDVALSYKNPLEAERGFRDLKSTIELRPVFHRLEPRIRAHVLLCWLALLLIRVVERRAGQTWRQLAAMWACFHARPDVG